MRRRSDFKMECGWAFGLHFLPSSVAFAAGQVTDFISFYILPSSVIGNSKHSEIKVRAGAARSSRSALPVVQQELFATRLSLPSSRQLTASTTWRLPCLSRTLCVTRFVWPRNCKKNTPSPLPACQDGLSCALVAVGGASFSSATSMCLTRWTLWKIRTSSRSD